MKFTSRAGIVWTKSGDRFRKGGKFIAKGNYRAALYRKAVATVLDETARETQKQYWTAATGHPEVVQRRIKKIVAEQRQRPTAPTIHRAPPLPVHKTERNLFGSLCDEETRAGLYTALERDWSAIRATLPPKEASRVRIHFMIGSISPEKLRKLDRGEIEDRGYRQFGTLDNVERFLTLTGKSDIDWDADALCQFKKEARIVVIPSKTGRGKKPRVVKRYVYDPVEMPEESGDE